VDRKKFIKEYSEALKRGTASVFLGAGVSTDAKYPSWKVLLKDIAEELDIDLDVEHDLAGVAQWYINHNKNVRTKIGRVIKNAFPPKTEVPKSLQVLSRLPLKHVWTTNYDRLIETAWELSGKRIDVKTRVDELAVPDPTASATLYKMHGSVDDPANVVISKEDYELYRREKGAFFHLLTGHSLGMSLLFIGFSFTDANVAHLFGLLREIVRDVPPDHYAIVRRPRSPDSITGAAGKEKARRELSRHRHWVSDLERYGLHCVEVDDFAEIPVILQELETAVANGSVFVSGSYPTQMRETAEGKLVRDVAEGVGRIVAEQAARLVSGYGLEVGSAAIAGVMGQAYKSKYVHLDSSLLLRPFPQALPKGVNPEDFKTRYREDMVGQSGVCVVIGGLVKKRGAYETAQGVVQEARIAREAGRPVLPLGATGGAAREIWHEMLKLEPSERYGISKRDFLALGETPASISAYLAHVDRILKMLRKV
jgi:hypothetical protein